jgi:DME family drug/metabolite transporter
MSTILDTVFFLNSLNSLMDFFNLMEFGGELLAVISAFCWALGASIYKKGLEGIDALSGNLMRTGFASAGFLLLMIANGTLIQSLHELTVSLLFWLVFSSFFAFFLGDLLFLIALKRIGVSRTVPISSTYPLFIAVWAFLVYGIYVSAFVVLGTLFIIVAIKLISEEKNVSHTTDSRGILFALSASLCWSISITVLDHLILYLPSDAVAGFRFMITFLLISAIGSVKKFTFNRNSLLWIGIGGMIVLVFGNYIFIEAIRMVGSAKVAPISATYPVISVFLAALFLKEKVTLKIIGGAFFSFFGVLLVVLG